MSQAVGRATPSRRHKRARDQDDHAQTTPTASVKKRRIDSLGDESPSTPKALAAMTSVLSSRYQLSRRHSSLQQQQPDALSTDPGASGGGLQDQDDTDQEDGRGSAKPSMRSLMSRIRMGRPAAKPRGKPGPKAKGKSAAQRAVNGSQDTTTAATTVQETPRRRGRKQKEAAGAGPESTTAANTTKTKETSALAVIDTHSVQDTPTRSTARKGRNSKTLDPDTDMDMDTDAQETPSKSTKTRWTVSAAHDDSIEAENENENEPPTDNNGSPAGRKATTPRRRLVDALGQQQQHTKPRSLRGILTPSRRGGVRDAASVRKSVSFGVGEKKSLQDPPLSSAKRGGGPRRVDDPVESDSDDDGEVCAICSRPDSAPPNEIVFCDSCDKAVHQKCYDVPDIPEGDWLCRECTQESVATTAATATTTTTTTATARAVDIPNFEIHLRRLQRCLIDRCTGKRRLRIRGQDEAYDKTRNLIEQTVLAGEGNSMMVIGPRGSGKTTLLEDIISQLRRHHRQDFHVVRLNGFIHTDDKLALRDIWRQLGKEMEVEDEAAGRTNHADTLASLLALLSHPEEITGQSADGLTSQSVVFVMDEFDMFAGHPRQTLLYNLFDIAQARKAPIAVIGATTRLDVVEMLEKRVKSRFSHRYVYLGAPKTEAAYWEICKQGLVVEEGEGEEDDDETGLLARDTDGFDEFMAFWRQGIESLYRQVPFQRLLQLHYFTSKSVPGFLRSWILPLSRLSASAPTLSVPPAWTSAQMLGPPADPKLHLLASLSELDLGLLIAAARLDIIAHTDTVNLAMAYDEYASLVGRQRVQSGVSSPFAAAAAGRVWGRGVAGQAWERLADLGVLVPAGVGGGGGTGAAEGKMWRVGVTLEEIPGAVRLNALMGRWCREI